MNSGCLRDRRDIGNGSVPGIGFVFAYDPEGLAPAVVPTERHPVSEGDGAEISRRWDKVGRPEAVREISHIARGERDSAPAFAGVLDPQRGVTGRAAFLHRRRQRLQSRRGHQIGMRRDRSIWQFDFRGSRCAVFPGEGHAHRIDFPFLRQTRRDTGSCSPASIGAVAFQSRLAVHNLSSGTAAETLTRSIRDRPGPFTEADSAPLSSSHSERRGPSPTAAAPRTLTANFGLLPGRVTAAAN